MRVVIVYNKPSLSYYDSAGEQKAVLGVLDEAAAIAKALTNLGHSVSCVSLSPPLDVARKKLLGLDADLVFNLFEGFTGSPGSEPDVPAILSERKMPYTGCPPESLRLTLDKTRTKEVLNRNSLNTPDSQLLRPATISAFRLSYPCIVKPNAEDASHGMTEKSVVRNHAEMSGRVSEITKMYGKDALVEEYIDGREFNVAVIGNREAKAMAVSEIAFALPPKAPHILTFSSKWDVESIYYKGTKAVCPAKITGKEEVAIKAAAEDSFRATGCRGYARVDMRMDKRDKLYIIEVNSNPDISPDSGAALQAGVAGLDYDHFIEKIVALALEVA